MYCTFSKNAQSSRERAETEAGTGVVVARHGFPASLTTKQIENIFEFCERVTRSAQREKAVPDIGKVSCLVHNKVHTTGRHISLRNNIAGRTQETKYFPERKIKISHL
ncbi:hypothetical protein EVAR_25535_1 [Eumeta japonica]|uniref:Uncharacterized protein n=1 Tax=Eumeta variegata TaxID=151549 RepID=A0A4C1VM69_EUMVA|nr:hypothetical protein EVAR_25535_1 [Eumeta japonica]